MGMTMTQKILAAHAGEASVKAGQLIQAKLDIVMGNDITTAVALKEFQKTGAKEVFDKDKVVIVLDHFTPNKDIKAAEQCKACRTFAYDMEVKNFFDVGQMGIEYALLPEKGIVVPGQVIIGADYHTCTYGALGAFSTGIGSTDMAIGMATGEAWFKVPSAIKFVLTGKPAKWVSGKDIILHIIGMIGVDGALYRSMEFVGDGIQYLTMDDRFSMANMAIEAGAKNGIFPVDEKTMEYVKKHSTKEPVVYEADPDAEYDEVYTIDLSKLRPTVAFPHLPENTKTIDEAGEIAIDQVVIGSCTNGRIEDLRRFARLVEGRRKADNITAWIVPGSKGVEAAARAEGLDRILAAAGFELRQPGCSACLAMNADKIPAGKYSVSTSNRNFEGRQGPGARTMLSGVAVAAAAAVTGVISDPREVFDM